MVNPNDNVSGNGSSSGGSLCPWGTAFREWNANDLARWFAKFASDLYTKYGGNMTLYAAPPIQNQPSGNYSGPQEVAQMYDAAKVVSGMLANLQEVFDREVALGLYVPLGQGSVVGPGGYSPYDHLFWTPNNESADAQIDFNAGYTFEEVFKALVALGYDFSNAADIMNSALTSYSMRAGVADSLVGPNGRVFRYTEIQQYLDVYTGFVGGLQQNTPQVQIGNQDVLVPFDASTSISEGQALIAPLAGSPAFGTPTNWLQGLYNLIEDPPGAGPPSMGHQYAGAGIGFEYLTMAYRLGYGDPQDSFDSFLAFTTDIVTRYEAVPIEAQLFVTKCQKFAVDNKQAYGIWDFISPAPLSPTDKKALALGKKTAVGHFPTRLQSWLIVGYNGVQPILPVTEGGLPVYTPDYNGAPKTSVVGMNPMYQLAYELVWRARVAFYAVNGGNQSINFGSVGKDATGKPIVSMWGSTIKFSTNSDGTPALPYFDDNTQYSDLAGALTAGLVTNVQLANVFQMGVVSDFVLAPLLGLVSGTPSVSGSTVVMNSVNTGSSIYNIDVAADFYKSANNKTMLTAWLSVTPVNTPFNPNIVVIPIPAPPQPAPDVGPYG